MFSILASRSLTSTIVAAALGCCCGPIPTDPQPVELAGTWVLEGEMPTGSALGTLTDVSFVFVSDELGDGHYLRGWSEAAGAEITAQVLLSGRADPRGTSFGIVYAPVEEPAEVHFTLSATGPMTGPSTFALAFSSPADPALTGNAILRRR